MGYSRLDLSSRIEMSYDANAQELRVEDVSLKGLDMGTVQVSCTFTNVTKDIFSTEPAVMQAAALGALLKKLDLRIDNAGLVDKAIALEAQKAKSSPEEIRKQYVTAAAIALPAALENGPAAKAIGAALAKFVATPKSFHLVATSANGLGASDFALFNQPSALLQQLSITAAANE